MESKIHGDKFVFEKLKSFFDEFKGKILVKNSKNSESNIDLQWTGVWKEPIDEYQYFTKIVIDSSEPFCILTFEISNKGRPDKKFNIWFQIIQKNIVGWIKPCTPFSWQDYNEPCKEFYEKYKIFSC